MRALVVVLPLVLMACNKGTDATSAASTPSSTVVVVDAVDGRAKITVGDMGYEPKAVRAKVGVPLTLVFTRTSTSPCGEEVTVPAFNIRKTLPLNEPVEVSFTPDKAGELAFVCGMNMMRGTIVVQ